MKLPDLSINFKEIYDLQYGGIKAWLLMNAVELKLFNLTKNENSIDKIAKKLNLHKGNTELFLNALCSLKLLKKNNSYYLNTESADTFLVEGKDTYIGDFLMMNNDWILQSKQQMKDLLIDGPAKIDGIEVLDDSFTKHTKAMRDFSRSGLSQIVSDIISRLPEFPAMKKMLDLGGAHGIDCIATVLKNPELKGVLFDKPPIIKTAKEIIKDYGMEKRIKLIGGDYTSDLIGNNYDLVYARATFNFIKDNLNPVFMKIYNSLNKGGIFISLHDGFSADKTEPADMVFSWFSASVSTYDYSMPQDLISNTMLETGFRSVQTKTLSLPVGTMDLVIARK